MPSVYRGKPIQAHSASAKAWTNLVDFPFKNEGMHRCLPAKTLGKLLEQYGSITLHPAGRTVKEDHPGGGD